MSPRPRSLVGVVVASALLATPFGCQAPTGAMVGETQDPASADSETEAGGPSAARRDVSSAAASELAPDLDRELVEYYADYWIIERPARSGGAAADGGSLVTGTSTSHYRSRLPLERTEVAASVLGHIVSTRISQRFRNPFDHGVRAIYSFSLPDDCEVHDFVLRIGEREIRAVVRERDEARRIYEAARAGGHSAALITRERACLFEQRVANILPGDTIDVSIRYLGTLPCTEGRFEFAVPPQSGPLALRVDVEAIDTLAEIECDAAGARVARLDPRRARVDVVAVAGAVRDGVTTRFRIESATITARLVAHRTSEDKDGEGHFALLVAAPLAAPLAASRDIDGHGGAGAGRGVYQRLELATPGFETFDMLPAAPCELRDGGALTIVGRFRGALPEFATLRWERDDRPGETRLGCERVAATHGLSLLWAQRRIRELTRALRSAPGDSQHRTLGAEIRTLALRHGLLSPFTSFAPVDALPRAADGAR